MTEKQPTTEMKMNFQNTTETGKNRNQTKETFVEKRLINGVTYKEGQLSKT